MKKQTNQPTPTVKKSLTVEPQAVEQELLNLIKKETEDRELVITLKELKEIIDEVLLAERSSWLNQKANEHDERIRADERSRVVEIVEGMDRYAHTRSLGTEKYSDGKWIRREELLDTLKEG